MIPYHVTKDIHTLTLSRNMCATSHLQTKQLGEQPKPLHRRYVYASHSLHWILQTVVLQCASLVVYNLATTCRCQGRMEFLIVLLVSGRIDFGCIGISAQNKKLHTDRVQYKIELMVLEPHCSWMSLTYPRICYVVTLMFINKTNWRYIQTTNYKLQLKNK